MYCILPPCDSLRLAELGYRFVALLTQRIAIVGQVHQQSTNRLDRDGISAVTRRNGDTAVPQKDVGGADHIRYPLDLLR